MPAYSYKGLNTQGKNTSGVIEAESEKAARLKLRKLGVFPTDVTPEGSRRSGGISLGSDVNFSKYFQRIKIQDLADMTRQLSTLLSAHIPMVDALGALVDQTANPKLRGIIGSVKTSVVQGSRLSEALAAHPKIFSGLFTHMIGAGEASGAMDTVMKRLADLLENQAKLKAKILGALMYPLIMAIVGLGLMGFLLVYVVPKVTKIFEDVKATLPIPTRILIAISHALANYWYVFILLGLGLFFGLRKFLKTPRGKVLYDRLTLKMPIFGKLFRMVEISRFVRTLATLLGSGVTLLNGLDIVKKIVQNSLLVNAIEETRVGVREGEPLAGPLKRSKQFPPIVIHMISIGEKTGELGTMMERIADNYDQQIDNLVGTLTTLLEPVMILVMGGLVSFIVMSILLPILQLNQLGS
ncbi:MAG: type II secretion system inner membrane protein GspF [Deltaproteobacteria bacterium]|nr:type II secretion system inner membrane protein GspF [Deltaproteobacteria bacterium]MBI2501263.1 type II secretion system inner membrane protein GspF [Deltaproteobacteria bacterium]MBI4197098.1 type II secretion system inner membrane protein GspF [Deltaproteobacteria bacterium]